MRFIKNACLLFFIMALLATGACSGGKASYNDGVYTAQAAEFASNGWKETMEITIENGDLISINWDAVYKDDSIPIRKSSIQKAACTA